VSKPPHRAAQSVLQLLAELQDGRAREQVDTLAGPIRPACELHGWTPVYGLRTNNFAAVASMCPFCARERDQSRREQEAPAVLVVEANVRSAGAYSDELWREANEGREAAGEILAGSVSERDLLQVIDSARVDAVARDRESAHDRRGRHRAHWAAKFGASSGRVYEPHPARAGGWLH
jgi:uncharacterized Zn finger protein (UPF0148 family)